MTLPSADGPSAGQSTIFMLLDLALGVRAPSGGATGGLPAFQDAMLAHTPPAHRALVRDYAERWHACGPLAAACKRRVLSRARDGALGALERYRRAHLGVASSYLVRTETGTGGTDFRTMLQDGVARTAAARGDSKG